MPRSSRHKSSKHSSRDARDYSDSEKDSCSKDRKSKEESTVRVSKDSGSGEKRKLDSRDNKDSFGSGNGEYLEEYSSSKRFKERAEDGVNDRWNGGDDDKGSVAYHNCELKARDLLQSNKLESLPDKRIRRKQDGSGDGDKHQDDIEDINDRRFSSREDGRPKDEKHKEERYRDKYREDKYRDERALKDHINSRYKDSRGRKISPDDHEDYNDAKSRGVKTLYLDMEKKSSSSSRVESDADRGRSQSHQAHPDNNTSSNRKRASPTQVLMELQMSTGASDRASKYRSAEKPTKADDGHIGDLSLERSSRSKASPMGLVDRSPTSSMWSVDP
ncbi:hypothetical protein GH714_039918 [Hevea brasiliensis]|uniref:Uncharacterized protein n=1 Tax=Hevea brasiliensis TaxID=3981 RepID=A0A6A6MSF4_HEVBR|nr:hypothetical protein GH714_039918 [Hevea brasiliensis]